MSVLISGSLAYDTIFSYPKAFSEQFVKSDLSHVNLCFQATQCERFFGGCAGNIAYGMSLLGSDPIVWSSLGSDGADYKKRMAELGIRHSLYETDTMLTAQCVITTDATGAQVASFAPNAMWNGAAAPWPENATIDLAIFAPDTRVPMLARFEALKAHRTPFLLDLGQTIPQFSVEELRSMVGQSHCVIVNDYELSLLTQRAGLDSAAILASAEILIVTHGAKGASWITQSEAVDCPAISVQAIDCVGAGDSFRSGLLHAMVCHRSALEALELGCTMASFKVERRGAQSYAPTLAEIRNRLESAYMHPASWLLEQGERK